MLPQGLALAKAWTARITKSKRNQMSSAILIQIIQELADKDRCGKLYVDDIEKAVQKLIEMTQLFVKDLMTCCTSC